MTNKLKKKFSFKKEYISESNYIKLQKILNINEE